jgi:hypothetical protein
MMTTVVVCVSLDLEVLKENETAVEILGPWTSRGNGLEFPSSTSLYRNRTPSLKLKGHPILPLPLHHLRTQTQIQGSVKFKFKVKFKGTWIISKCIWVNLL